MQNVKPKMVHMSHALVGTEELLVKLELDEVVVEMDAKSAEEKATRCSG
jgi:hypothetical protein